MHAQPRPIRSLILAVLAIPLLLAGCSHPQAVYYPPPPSYTAIAQQGFHDGYLAAQHDVARNLPPDAARHPRFRQPPVPPAAWNDYRHGFRDGYQRFLHQGPPPGQ